MSAAVVGAVRLRSSNDAQPGVVRLVVGPHPPEEPRRGGVEPPARERLRLEIGLEQLCRGQQPEVREVDVGHGGGCGSDERAERDAPETTSAPLLL